MRILSEKAQALADTPGKPPSKEFIVKALTDLKETVTRKDKNGTERSYTVRTCSKGKDRCLHDGRIELLEKSGFTNPYGHLMKFVYRGDERFLLDA